jgi:tRNA threonylcarbamoyladenosine biosynthesis protein TsaE
MGTLPRGALTALDLVSQSPQQTQELGAMLGRLARGSEVILLIGPLGVGKTCLVQGLAQGLEVYDYVSSPTFTLIREHRGRLPLYHIDFFRLQGEEEALGLGLEEYLEGEGVCAVEWADRALAVLPPEHLRIRLDFGDGEERALHLEAHGPRYRALLEEVRAIL